MRSVPKRFSIVPAVIYFAILAPGKWTLLLLLMALLASIPAFVLLIVSRGRRLTWATLLLFIPFAGAVYAIYKLLRRSSPLVALSVGIWVYPLLILFTSGATRLLLATLGSGIFWALLTFYKPFRAKPTEVTTFLLAFPTLSFFLLAALVLPFLASTADVDVDLDGDKDFDLGLATNTSLDGESASIETFHSGASDSHSSLYQSHQDTHGFGSEVNTPNAFEETPWNTYVGNSSPPGASPDEVADSLFARDSMADTSISSPSQYLGNTDVSDDFAQQIDEVSFDTITGDPTVHSGSERIEFRYSETSDRLVGRLTDGASVEVWSSPVTNDIFVGDGGHISKFHLDPIDHSWKSVGPEGTVRIFQDPISGNLRISSPNFESTFRYSPFENKLIAE